LIDDFASGIFGGDRRLNLITFCGSTIPTMAGPLCFRGHGSLLFRTLEA